MSGFLGEINGIWRWYVKDGPSLSPAIPTRKEEDQGERRGERVVQGAQSLILAGGGADVGDLSTPKRD